MKRIILLTAAAVVALAPAAAKKKQKDVPNDSLVFTTVIEHPVTSVKNQFRSGTCWAYSALSYLESEAMKKNPELKDIDLCESFMASKTYMDQAVACVRLHGDKKLTHGGSFCDAIYCLEHYGLAPEGTMPYPITAYGDSLFQFDSFFPPMEAYVGAIAATKDKKAINPAWKKNVQGMLDSYFGPCPEEFDYKGQKHTPQSFAKDFLKLNPEDYVSLTSYSHHPFYKAFVLEIQDNWRYGMSYNLPIDELMRVMEESVKNGWTYLWGADVSEDGFSRKAGKNQSVATVPNTKEKAGVGTDQSKWTGEEAGNITEQDGSGEKTITQAMRQEAFDNWETTDDHGMHIYGIAKDQHGKEYFMMKNSWGESGPYKGFWYVSKPYMAYKTMNIVINKNAIPADIRSKLGV